MSTLAELAVEYRVTAAHLAMAVAEHERKGDLPEREMQLLRRMLEDTRAVQRTVSGYYTVPRTGELDSSSWRAGGSRHDDN